MLSSGVKIDFKTNSVVSNVSKGTQGQILANFSNHYQMYLMVLDKSFKSIQVTNFTCFVDAGQRIQYCRWRLAQTFMSGLLQSDIASCWSKRAPEELPLDDPVSTRSKCSLTCGLFAGLRVAQIRVIFTLPSQYGTLSHPLAGLTSSGFSLSLHYDWWNHRGFGVYRVVRSTCNRTWYSPRQDPADKPPFSELQFPGFEMFPIVICHYYHSNTHFV